MDYLAVIVTAAIGFGVGALWYGVLSKPWVVASGVPTDANGAPRGGANPVTFAGAYLCILLVAGMMRHVFAMGGINTVGLGLMGGLGIGLFFIAPWITLNVLFAQRPKVLALIDGGYATIACAVMGGVLTLF
ncbi:DUF1761 domain-containing protein [Pararhodobacter zhoushanensis]|uniref:DUF1761 domain-containing protein n=1 Tax=Pararhodobacter zhoushanensis TaxID=2479545 RepID=A0ABT3GTS2_9RHOB|nr:DUF1761 domain-containing protein [Pararhodobacter zhoushanensis]MCW1930904.1 DUF1761 domain-containing protein [Pararhodobacter zhoushanensis]